MEISRVCILILCLCLPTTTLFTPCDARRSSHFYKAVTISRSPWHKKLKVLKHFDIATPLDTSSSDNEPYGVSSPFSLPPFDSLGPMPMPENTPPFCENPPSPTSTFPGPAGGAVPSLLSPPPPSPSTTVGGGYTPLLSPPPPELPQIPPSISTPISPISNPPPSPIATVPSPSSYVPSPLSYIPSPSSYIPSPLGYIPNPPIYIPSPTEPGISPPYYEPSPPSYGSSPPSTVPSPSIFVPSPPIFQPPVVYPPPIGPPPHRTGPSSALWCVAKPSVPDPIIQEAMNYACGSGADCDSLQPSGSCFQPNTLLAHASYAFNSYWQRTKVAGGTCEFGGTAILVTVDPSYDGCHFIYY